MKKRIMSCILVSAVIVATVYPWQGSRVQKDNYAKVAYAKEGVDMIIQYDEPADDWELEALPIGNGSIGAMVFGGVDNEHLQINESTVWSGGPGSNSNYNGGSNSYSNEQVHDALQSVRQRIQNMVNDFAENKAAHKDDSGNITAYDYPDLTSDSEFMKNLDILKGVKGNFGTYQSLGDINIINNESVGSGYSNYLRKSDISNALQTVSYDVDNVSYKREYFINNPSNVMVCRLTASEKGKINNTIRLSTEHNRKNIYVDMEQAAIVMEGQPNDQKENGLKFAQVIKVINEGGSIDADGNNGIKVENADSVVIIMSAGTNYKSDSSGEYNYFEDEEPIVKVDDRVARAAAKGYDALYEEHLADYRSLFNRCLVNIGASEVPEKMTDDLLADYDNGNSEAEDRYLETLFFQYGRYLLISSSRANSKLPANLQGIWAQGLSPMWNSDFHTNINLQMNYWLAEQTGLSECHTVVLDYINDMVEKGRETAKKYYCKQDGSDVRGWVIHHENNIWGNTNPSDWTTAFYFPAAAAWQCQDMWEAYQYTKDRKILEKYYDSMLEAALFWVDNLWTDERDGTLVANPSYSPEHGTFTMGCVCDQAIIWELFDEVEKAAAVLGRQNEAEVAEVTAAKAKLYMPKADTLGGQFREWKDETKLEIENTDNHRHQNQLYVLHPGTYVVCGRSEEDDKLAEAARVTLEKRGDGGTGWSKAWKINMWARLRDGNRAKKLLAEQLKSSTLKNLFDTHPPFQIDGNFGATSGIAEMLLQSQGDYIEPLAALPEDWSNGSYSGIRARGNFDLSVEWSDCVANDILVKSGSGIACALKYNDISKYNVVNMTSGARVVPTIIDNNAISFPTVAGNIYRITTKSVDEYIKPADDKSGEGNTAAVTTAVTTAAPGVNTPADSNVNIASGIKLAAPKIKSIKAKGKKAVNIVISKKIKNADGYVIMYSVRKNMKQSKTVLLKSSKTLKATIKKLKKGKKYYFRVRAYKAETGSKIFSKWSSMKSVKIK